MPTVAPEILASGLTFAECPRWHNGELFVSDMHGHTVFAIAPDGTTRVVAELPVTPGGLGWLPDGTLLIVSQEDRRILRAGPGGLSTHADLSGTGASALNDMWVTDAGYSLVGEMGFNVFHFLHPQPGQPAEEVRTGQVFCLDPAGALTSSVADLIFPNGIVISPVTGRVVVAESFGFSLTELDLDPAGKLTRGATTKLTFAPDGIAADSEGCIWVADPAGHRAVRIAPDGRELDSVACDQQCLAVMLGGDDGRTLFLCTSPTTDPAELRRVQGSRIEVATVDVPAW